MKGKENYMGKIAVSDRFMRSLVRETVSGCFGVAGMKSFRFTGYLLSDLLKLKEEPDGIGIYESAGGLILDLHIVVTFGTNIPAVAESIRSKVEFAVSEKTGYTVSEINIYVDDIVN